jgi:hypothetical protein
MRGGAAVAALLIIGFAVGALAHRGDGGAAQKNSAQGERGTTRNDAVASYDSVGGTQNSPDVGRGVLSAAPAGAGGTVAGAVEPGLSDRIIRNADLTVRVKKGSFDSAWANAVRVATKFGGYVVSSSRGTQPVVLSGAEDATRREPASGDVTVRVPASRFEQALIEMRALGTVTSDAISSQDVTQEFVDLQSRLRNQKAQQAVLLRLMSRAKTIEETLAVQQQLSVVEQQIEEITGRLNALKLLTDLSVINLHLFEPGAAGAPVPAPEEGPSFAKAWETAVEGLERIGTVALIGGLWLTPFAALAGAGIAIRRMRVRPAAPTA